MGEEANPFRKDFSPDEHRAFELGRMRGRNNFGELLKDALRKIAYKTYSKEKIWDTVFDTIDDLLKECAED